MCAGYTLPWPFRAGPMGGAIGHPAIVSEHSLTLMLVSTYLLSRIIRNEY